MTVAQTLLLVLLLLLKHCYADFKLQTYIQTVRKGIYLDLVGMSHSMEHVWTTMVALLVFNLVFPLPASLIFGLAMLEGVLHYHIDWYKVKYGVKDTTKQQFWTQFGVDQLVHQITYLAMVYYVVGVHLA